MITQEFVQQYSETNFMFITYPQPNGQVAIVTPCGDVNDAIKDVPSGDGTGGNADTSYINIQIFGN